MSETNQPLTAGEPQPQPSEPKLPKSSRPGKSKSPPKQSSQPRHGDVITTPTDAAALIQSAISYCRDANLQVRYQNRAFSDGTPCVLIAIGNLRADPAVNGRVDFSAVETPPAVNGSAYTPEEIGLD